MSLRVSSTKIAETEAPGSERLSPLLTMLWIAGMPIFAFFGNRLPRLIPVLTADRLTFVLAAAPLVLTAVRRPRLLRPPGWVEMTMAVYLAVIFISWGTTLPRKDLVAFKEDADFLLTCFVMPFTAFVIARNTQWTRERMLASLWVLVGGVGIYLSLHGAAQYTFDWNFLASAATPQDYFDRAKGPYDSAVVYGIVLLILVLPTMFLSLQSRRRLERVALAAIALGLVQAIVASKTRVVWLGLPVALLLPSVRYPRIRPLSACLVAVLAAQVLLLPAVGLDSLGLRNRLVQPQPVSARLAASATAWNMVRHKPLFGFGFGMFTFDDEKADYYTAWGDVSPQSAVYPNNPHNEFLNVLVLMGVIGFIPYAALLTAIGYELWRRRNEPLASDLAVFVQSAFLILIISGQFHSVMHMSYVQIVFFFLLGMVARGPAEAAETQSDLVANGNPSGGAAPVTLLELTR